MKLELFINFPNDIFGYYITEASKSFISAHPKKHIAVSISKNIVKDFDTFDELPFSSYEIDYFFTRDSKLVNNKESKKITKLFEFGKEKEDVLKVYPVNLSNYLIKESREPEDIDLVLKIAPNSATIDPRYMNMIVFKTNHSNLLQADINASIKTLIETVYSKKNVEKISTTEEWLNSLLNDIPFDLRGRALQFPPVITDSMFKNYTKPTLDLFSIGYMARVGSTREEIEVTQALEKAFSNFDTELSFVNDYTDIVGRIINACKAKKVKYQKTELGVRINAKDFYSLGLEFNILNFFD